MILISIWGPGINAVWVQRCDCVVPSIQYVSADSAKFSPSIPSEKDQKQQFADIWRGQQRTFMILPQGSDPSGLLMSVIVYTEGIWVLLISWQRPTTLMIGWSVELERASRLDEWIIYTNGRLGNKAHQSRGLALQGRLGSHGFSTYSCYCKFYSTKEASALWSLSWVYR